MTDVAANSSTVSGAAVITDPTGLHARPAVKLTRLAKTFAADVGLCAGPGGKWINAKSPNAVMKLKVAHGETLHVRASGTDAADAVAALTGLIDKGFDG